MSIDATLKELDKEIARLTSDAERLTKLRASLVSAGSTSESVARRAYKTTEPKKGIRAKAVSAKKRTISPEGRKRIAEAQKRRWAIKKKAASAQK